MRLISIITLAAAAFVLGGCLHTVSYKPLDSGAHWTVRPEGIEHSQPAAR